MAENLAEALWGENFFEIYIQIMSKPKESSKEEAKKVLDAIIHSEIRQVLSSLESQMEKKVQIAKYDIFDLPEMNDKYLAGLIDKTSFDNVFLFSDWSYNHGFCFTLAKIIERAHPEYKWTDSSIGAMTFERKE